MMSSKPNYQHHVPKIASSGDTGNIQKNFTFLPMLCSSTSTKQLKLTHRRCSSSSSSSTTVTDDPSSPKVGCMGQVKRNNKVVNFPNIISFTSSSSSSSNSSSNSNCSTRHRVIKCHESNAYTSNSIIRYYKLIRFFSTKSPTSVISATSGAQKGKIRRKNVCRSKVDENVNSCNNKKENDKGNLVNLLDMDPPLPVMKKIVKKQGNDDGEDTSSLWKRRSGGAPLKSLRVQVIPQNISLVPANTV
ncbi:hypothetical protein RND81_01G215600 [Saponaria officinalis]|uniref:Uncharacterized protein n=1 Tax=Saponaria officinalis TaxID=3572 RepID=A0AAW1NK30_SAPOF